MFSLFLMLRADRVSDQLTQNLRFSGDKKKEHPGLLPSRLLPSSSPSCAPPFSPPSAHGVVAPCWRGAAGTPAPLLLTLQSLDLEPRGISDARVCCAPVLGALTAAPWGASSCRASLSLVSSFTSEQSHSLHGRFPPGNQWKRLLLIIWEILGGDNGSVCPHRYLGFLAQGCCGPLRTVALHCPAPAWGSVLMAHDLPTFGGAWDAAHPPASVSPAHLDLL